MAITWSYEDFRADGISLKNYGFGISLVGGLTGVPPRVGSNIPVAYRRGTKFRPKQFTEIKRSLTMWIDCRDPLTGLYPSDFKSRIGQRNDNISLISRIFGNVKKEIGFERDVIVAGGATQTWTAKGEYVGDALLVNWNDNSDEETNFNVDILFADPFWYEKDLYTGPSVAVGGGGVTVQNTGDVSATDMTVTFTATTTLVNPVLTNSTNGVSLTLTTSISAGDSVVVDTKYPRVKRTSDSANLIGTVTNSGSRSFMEVERGSNTLTLAATSGTGNAVLAYYPPHF